MCVCVVFGKALAAPIQNDPSRPDVACVLLISKKFLFLLIPYMVFGLVLFQTHNVCVVFIVCTRDCSLNSVQP